MGNRREYFVVSFPVPISVLDIVLLTVVVVVVVVVVRAAAVSPSWFLTGGVEAWDLAAWRGWLSFLPVDKVIGSWLGGLGGTVWGDGRMDSG